MQYELYEIPNSLKQSSSQKLMIICFTRKFSTFY